MCQTSTCPVKELQLPTILQEPRSLRRLHFSVKCPSLHGTSSLGSVVVYSVFDVVQVIGHESAGIVSEVGASVKHLKVRRCSKTSLDRSCGQFVELLFAIRMNGSVVILPSFL